MVNISILRLSGIHPTWISQVPLQAYKTYQISHLVCEHIYVMHSSQCSN